MVKFREASPGAAYEIADGVTAAEAAELGLAVVESTPDGLPSAYGRYKDAPDGGPLGITVSNATDTKVIGGGGAAASVPSSITGGKGALVNPNDPIIHGGTGDDTVHADGAAPPVVDNEALEREQAEIAKKSIEDASKATRKSSK